MTFITMLPRVTHRESALRIVQQHGTVRWRDFASQGVTPSTVERLVRDGQLIRIGHGLYQASDFAFSEHQSLVEAQVAVPHGIIGLLSALRVHGLTTQSPQFVWMLIEGKARRPAVTPVRMKFLRASGLSFSSGVEARVLEGVTVHVTTAAKTVADCFKYRRHVGLDVAIEALRDGLQRDTFTPAALLAAARTDRVETLIRPYMEALL